MKSLHFLYHELRPAPSDYSYVTECAAFERHCRLFAQLRGARVDSLRPQITFDDGHCSNYEFALPILQQHGLQAQFFITVGWSGKRTGFMDWKELRGLHASGQAVGAHGWSHKLLTRCSEIELHRELVDARQRLEDGLGSAVLAMSLPGGRANARVLQACWQAGYRKVFTSSPQPADSILPAEKALVGRVNMRSGASLQWLEELLRPGSGLLASLERQDRLKRGARVLLGDRVYARLWSVLNRSEPESDLQAFSA